jgi:transposase
MIVIGVDVHKHSLSAVAVDEVGRQIDCLETSDAAELVSWSKRVARRRLWALEDCRHVTRGLEGTLQRHRQRLVRVPPRLTAPERRRGRVRGKSDLIDALAAINATVSTAAATANSTAPCTASRSPRPRPPTSTGLPRTQASRRQEPPRSPPLPQTPTRPNRLHHPQERAPIDIGATLAQATVEGFGGR